MEESILNSTKKILGLVAEYTAFDQDIITHINSSLNVLNQLGVGVPNFMIVDDSAKWEDFIGAVDGMNLVKSYVFLKVRMLFDPPSTSFAIEAMNKQIEEFEWRLNAQREWLINPNDPRGVEEVVLWPTSP
jgi:hypothetical protein